MVILFNWVETAISVLVKIWVRIWAKLCLNHLVLIISLKHHVIVRLFRILYHLLLICCHRWRMINNRIQLLYLVHIVFQGYLYVMFRSILFTFKFWRILLGKVPLRKVSKSLRILDFLIVVEVILALNVPIVVTNSGSWLRTLLQVHILEMKFWLVLLFVGTLL